MNKRAVTKKYTYKSWQNYFKNSDIDISKLPINEDWKEIVVNMNLDKYNNINDHITESIKNNKKIEIYPYPELVFNAFNFSTPKNIKVVFIGQDPYPNFQIIDNINTPDAMGMSFSVPIGSKIPSSLNNIFLNGVKYKHIKKYPIHGNLEAWAKQGCLFLNTTLTVEHKKNNEHSFLWSDITDSIIQKISDDSKNVVFVLWGKFALSKKKFIDTNKHTLVISSHPSGLSCHKKMGNYPSFSELDQFGTINKALEDIKSTPIDWDY